MKNTTWNRKFSESTSIENEEDTLQKDLHNYRSRSPKSVYFSFIRKVMRETGYIYPVLLSTGYF